MLATTIVVATFVVVFAPVLVELDARSSRRQRKDGRILGTGFAPRRRRRTA